MKLVTWNIQWGRGADGRVDLDRVVADLRRFCPDADVVCLQEVSAGFEDLPGVADAVDQFAALAARLPGHALIDGAATDLPGAGGARRRFGNAILTRLPVRQVLRHLLPWPADPEVKSMQRAAVEATLDAPIGPLRVTTTHLAYYSARQRVVQVERLRELQREGHAHALQPRRRGRGPFTVEPRGVGSVVCGDFNCRPEAPERARLTAPFDDATPTLRDAWELMHPGVPHPPTVGLYDKAQWPGEPFTFDYVLVSADLAPRVRALDVDAVTAASDHQPLRLELA
ncbi:MAG: endonuclease/exonuclease/phosphatase family protein [Betaproteobacteria bacterium]